MFSLSLPLLLATMVALFIVRGLAVQIGCSVSGVERSPRFFRGAFIATGVGLLSSALGAVFAVSAGLALHFLVSGTVATLATGAFAWLVAVTGYSAFLRIAWTRAIPVAVIQWLILGAFASALQVAVPVAW